MCRMLRGLAKFRNLPIILLTGRDGFSDRFKGHIAGSNKYLTKPFDREQLRETVSELLSR